MTEVNYNSDVPAVLQTADWTCSACSLAWLNRSVAIDVATDEWSSVAYIGQPEHINSTWGLMDASGSRLAYCLTEQGAPAFTGWLAFWETYRLAQIMPLLIGGQRWYHWSGVRFGEDSILYLANPAPGWMGIDDSMREDQFCNLGPFAIVAVPLYPQIHKLGEELSDIPF